MANNSEGIMARYKKYLTNQQKKKLRSLYAGYRQTTADERREAYLQARRAGNNAAATASAMGLGSGYAARKQAATDAEIDKYGLQLDRQADAAFESNAVVPMANATIKAQNEAAKKAYEEEVRKRKAALAAYEAWVKEQEEKKRKEQEAKAAQAVQGLFGRLKGAMGNVNNIHPIGQSQPRATGEYDPRFGSGGQQMPKPVKPDTSMPKAPKLTQEFYDPRFGSSGQNDNALRTESPVTGKTTRGSIYQPKFSFSSTEDLKLTPELERQVNEASWKMTKAEIPEYQSSYLEDVKAYRGKMSELAPSFNRISTATRLVGDYNKAVSDANNPGLSVAVRKQRAQDAQNIARQYDSLFQNGILQKDYALIQQYAPELTEMYNNIQVKQGVLQKFGIEYSDEDIEFDMQYGKSDISEDQYVKARGLLGKDSSVSDSEREKFWEIVKNVKLVDSGEKYDSGYAKYKFEFDSSDAAWLRTHGFGEILENPHLMYTPNREGSPEQMFGQNVMDYLSNIMTRGDEYYHNKNNHRALAKWERFTPKQKVETRASGENETHLQEYFNKAKTQNQEDVYKAVCKELGVPEGTVIDGETYIKTCKKLGLPYNDETRMNAASYGEIAKKLGLPDGYITEGTFRAMRQEDIDYINMCYGMGLKDVAKDYIFDLTEMGNAIIGKEMADNASSWPKGIKFVREWMTAFGYGVLNGTLDITSLDLLRSEKTPTAPREFVMGDIIQNQTERGWNRDFAKATTGGIYNVGEMVPTMALYAAGGAVGGAVGGVAGSILSKTGSMAMFLSAGGRSKQQALREGYSNAEATAYGFLAGLSETVFQEYLGGLTGISDKGWVTRAFSDVLEKVPSGLLHTLGAGSLDVVSEISQELFGDFIDPLLRNIGLGEHNDALKAWNWDDEKETVLVTAVSTVVLNSLAGIRSKDSLWNNLQVEDAKRKLRKNYGFSMEEANFYIDTERSIAEGEIPSLEEQKRFAMLGAKALSQLEGAAETLDAVNFDNPEGLAPSSGLLTSRAAGKTVSINGKVAEYVKRGMAETLDATDHTAELADLKGKAKARYLIDASPTGKIGNLYFTTEDGKTMDVSNMSLKQKANFVIAQKLAKAFPNIKIVAHNYLYGIDGVNHVVEGQAPEIHVSLNGSAMVMTTAAHELLHQVEKTDAKAYKNIQSYLTTLLDESEIATTEKNVASKYGIEYTVDKKGNKVFKNEKAQKTFESEVAAHLVEKVLIDDSFLDRIIRDSDPKNRTAKAKLINGLKDVIDRVAKALRGEPTVSGKLYKLQRTIEKAYREMGKADLTATKTETEEADFEAVEKDEKQKEEAVKEATEKVEEMPTIEEASTEEIEKNPGISFLGNRDTLGKTMDRNMEPMFRVSDWNADEDVYREMATRFNLFGSKAKTDEFFNMMRRIADNISRQTEKGIKSLDYSISEDESMSDFHPEEWYDGDERTYSPVKPNSDPLYKWSIDFSTLCRKRLLQQAVQKRLEAQLKRNLSVDEQIAIRNALKNLQNEGKKIEVACALCYVEAARFRSPKQISRFMSDRQGFLLKQIQDKALADEFKAVREEVKEKYGVSDMKALRKNAKAKAEFTDRIDELRDNYKPTAKEQALLDAVNDYDVTDFTTPAGLEKLARENRELYDAYTTFIRQATKSKALETSTPWRAGDSEKISDAEFQAFNSENGLRSNSWSDFQVMHLLDYISSIIELSTRNAKMQAYTKVANYARLMGDTGVMINLSLIPTAKYTKGSKMDNVSDYDPVEGMDYTLALQLRKEHANTVGTICIATNDEQLEALCANPNVDMVIPYHDSGMSKANRKKMGIPDWQSYQKVQSEKEVTLPKEAQTKDYHKPIKFSDWFDYDEAVKTAKIEGAFAAMEKAARKYLDLCKERGYTPKFADYTKVKGYWKLLTDRKMINQETGEIIKQEAVKPVFDEGTINSIIKEEVDNYAEFSKDFDAASDAVFEQFKDGNFKTTTADKRLADSVNNAYISAVMGDDMMRVSDTEYLSLAEKYRDGTATEEEKAELEKQVQEAAKKAGYTLAGHHGTKRSPFTIFKRGQSGGIYMASNRRVAEGIAGNSGTVMDLYVRFINPLVVNDHVWTSVPFYDSIPTPKIMREAGNTQKTVGTEEISLFAQERGYDGVIIEGIREGGDTQTDDYIAFRPSQIKSADPVTYDDNGDIIPLSERFNAENEDIRYRYSDEPEHRGQGYDGYSMSVNARIAYNSGQMPLSKWTKTEILNRVAEIDEAKVKLIENVNLDTLRNELLYPAGWHHTSSMYNRTDFYGIDEEVVNGLTEDVVSSWERVKKKATVENAYRGDFHYIEWGGTRNHPKANPQTLTDVNIQEKGSFYIVTDDNGNQLARKKIGSNGTYTISYEEEARRKEQARKWEEERVANSSEAANQLYNELMSRGYERSSSGNIYEKGRKPSRYDYESGDFFKEGERRLSLNENDNGYHVEVWRDGDWHIEEEKTEDVRYRISDYSEDETIVGTPIDTAAVRRAVKTGKKQTTKDGYTVKIDTGENNKYTVTVSRDGEVINTREGVANEELKGADIERTAAALMRNIKKGRANSNDTSTSDIYIDKGENPARDVNVPKSARQGMKTSKLARTIAEAPGMTDESVDELMNKVYRGFMSYKPDVNQESMDKALKKIEDNMAEAVVEWNQVANSGRILTPDDVALGSALMVSASQSGDVNSAMEIASQLQDLATTGGKFVQSFRMIKRLGAAGAFYYVNRQVAKINAELEKQAKGYKLTLNEELIKKLFSKEVQSDYHKVREVTEEIRKDLGQQLKPTLRDWLTAWRNTAMLGNIKTLMRNDIGNMAYVPVVMMDNVLNTVLQAGLSKIAPKTFSKTTKLFAGKQYREFANWDWKDTVKYDIKGNKYSEGQLGDIKDYMRYDTGAKGILKPAAKAFDWWRSTTQKFMEDESKLGDMAFKKLHYQHALATRLDQLKVDVKTLQDVLVRSRNNEAFEEGTREAKLLAVYEAATQYAVSEANRNTYNDINAFANFVSQISRTMYEKQDKNGRHPLRVGHYLIEGILPFKNTPANIVARAAEHSPIGLAKTITLDLGKVIKGAIAEQQFAKGKISKQKYENLIASSISGEQFIHNLSSGLTGSALFVLGAILAKAGLLHGGLGYDDPEDKEKRRRGHQSYEIELLGNSFTLDWLAPECIPLFMGVELVEQLGNMTAEEWNEKGLKALLNVTTGAFEPMLNMSMLQGINELFTGFAAEDDLKGFNKFAATVGTSYLTQFQPTLIAQIARSIDPYVRTTYNDKNSKLPPFMQKFWQSAAKKVPGLTFLLPKKIDEMGNYVMQTEGALRWVEQLALPWYRKTLTDSPLDQKIAELGVEAYPSAANKYIDYGGDRINLTAQEYDAYATTRGQIAGALMNAMLTTEAFNNLSDVDQVKAFEMAYKYGDTIAKSTVLGMKGFLPDEVTPGKLEGWVGKANKYAEVSDKPTALADFIAIKAYIDRMDVDGGVVFGDIADYTYTNEDGEQKVRWNMMKWDYLKSLNLTDKERLFLADAFGAKKGAYASAEAATAEVPGLTADAYTAALDMWQELTKEKNQKKEQLSGEDYEKWLAGNTLTFKNYLNDSKELTGQQKFALLSDIGNADGWESKAKDLNNKYGIDYDTSWEAAYKYSTLTSTDDEGKADQFTKWLNSKTELTGQQRFSMYGAFVSSGSKTFDKATAFATGGTYENGKYSAAKYGKPSYDTLWNAYTAYKSTSNSDEFYKWVNKQSGMTGLQRFACVEFTQSSTMWVERAVEVNSKMGISYDTLWKIKLYWSGESGQGKKARITAYCKSLGLKQSQIDKLYDFRFLT